jgi:hypothetical protein
MRLNTVPPRQSMRCLAFLLALSSLYACGGRGSLLYSPISTPDNIVSPVAQSPSLPFVDMLSIYPKLAVLSSGDSLQFTVLNRRAIDPELKWLVNGIVGGDATAGTISHSGLYIAPLRTTANTEVIITVMGNGRPEITGKATVTITPAPAPIKVSVSPSSANLTPRQTQQFTAHVTGTTNQTVKWLVNGSEGGSSSVGTISRSGFYIAPSTIPVAIPVIVTAVSSYASDDSARAVITISAATSSAPQCGPPSYNCAITSTSVFPLPNPLPGWGGLIGAGTIFTEKAYNPAYPPTYARVTDANSGSIAGNTNSGFAVGSGSGDDSHFNLNDTLFWITDSNAAIYFYGLDPATMATRLVNYGNPNSQCGAGMWSQTNPNNFYDVCLGAITRLDFTGLSFTNPGTPASTTLYSFINNCNVNSTIQFYVAAGVGGSLDSPTFGTMWSPQTQDPLSLPAETQVAAYNSGISTCYNYDTMSGVVRSYTGQQTPVTGTVTCNGSTTVIWENGTTFNPTANAWTGLNITIGGSNYQIASVGSTSSLTLTTSCNTGGSYSTQPGTLVGVVTSHDRFSVHDTRIDPSGTYMIVELGSQCPTGSCHYIHAWKIGTTTVLDCVDIAGGSDSGACGAHYTTIASGWVNADYFGSNIHSPSMQFRSWNNFTTTNPSNVFQMNAYDGTALNDPNFDDHPTAKNDPLGTHNYPILTSTYAPDDPGSLLYAYSNEIIGWNQSGGPVMRFGHDFNSSQSTQFTAQYAIGAASSTGQFYIFTTDGEGTLGNNNGSSSCSILDGTCRSDVFLLRIGGATKQ